MKNAKFKDSGVQWLGEIPQHWEVRKLKFVAKEIISGGTPNTSKGEFWSESEKDSYLWVAIEDMTNADFIKTTKKCITKKGLENSSARIIPPYSILYSIYASLGKIAYSNKYLTTNQAILGIVTKEFYFYKYCFYSLMSLTKTLISLSNKTTQDNINLDILRNIKIPLPPLDEQRQIAEFLDSKCAKIAEFIDKKQQIISLLKEQKLALINESTCGRIPNFLYKSDFTKSPLSCEAQSKSPLPCEVESKLSPLPCGGGLGVGIKTSKFGKDFTPPLAPPARGGEQKSGDLASGKEYVGLPRTSGGEQEVSHRPLAPYMKDFSRAMRKNPTQAENKLWQELRGKKLGFGFRRQFVIDSKYIADFVCLEKRLIIECDGGQHNKYELPHPKSLCYGEGLETSESLTQAEGLAHKAQSKSPLPCKVESKLSPLPCGGGLGVGKDILTHPDIQRDFYLESQNFRILRFWNNEILGNLEGVLRVIKEALESNVDFANVKSTCESTHPLAPSAREGECVESQRASEGEREGGDFAREGEQKKAPTLAGGVWGGVSATMEGERESSPHAFKFKHSGIEWLGVIPSHWEVRKLKQIGVFNKGNNITKKYISDEGLPFIVYGDIYTKYNFKALNIAHKISSENANLATLVKKNTLLFSASGEIIEDIGKCVVLLTGYAYIGGDVITLNSVNCDSVFLSYAINSAFATYQKATMGKGDIIVHIHILNLKNLQIPLPPLDEQKQIAEFLDKKCAKIDKAIALIEQEIQAIKEYKTSLIDKAVRGQI